MRSSTQGDNDVIARASSGRYADALQNLPEPPFDPRDMPTSADGAIYFEGGVREFQIVCGLCGFEACVMNAQVYAGDIPSAGDHIGSPDIGRDGWSPNPADWRRRPRTGRASVKSTAEGRQATWNIPCVNSRCRGSKTGRDVSFRVLEREMLRAFHGGSHTLTLFLDF